MANKCIRNLFAPQPFAEANIHVFGRFGRFISPPRKFWTRQVVIMGTLIVAVLRLDCYHQRNLMDANRNTDEFVRLFSLYTNSIYSYIHLLVPIHADAEDVFQETSRTLWQKYSEYQPGPDVTFRAWALRIAQLEVLRYRQRQGRRGRLFSDQLQAALDNAAALTIEALQPRFEVLDDCYQRLPEDDRRLIDARYRRGSSVETLAGELDRSVHSVYRALRRIHQSLFECMSRALRDGEELSR